MSIDKPFRLGPFIVDERGWLTPEAPESFPSFSVRWRDRVLHVRRAPICRATGRGSLAVRAVLGRIPSTAGPDRARRAEAFSTLRGLPPLLPAGWEVSLFADHRVGLDLEAGLELPATATALVTAITLLLLELAPYLDVLDAAGIVAVPGAGMANAWPG